MLVHECSGCNALSINRIAADDDAATVMAVFQESLAPGQQLRTVCQAQGIVLLKAEDTKMVHGQLYGRSAEIPVFGWK